MKRMSRPSRVASMRATARRSLRQESALWRVSAIAAHDVLVADGALGANGVGSLVDFLRQRLRAGKAEHVVDVVVLAPGHRLGPGVMSVAAEQDARLRPAGADAADEPAQMGANLDADGRLAGTQDDRDGSALLRVIDMDRQKAALVVMGVEQRELLMAVDDIAGVVDVERDGGGASHRKPSIDRRACRSGGSHLSAAGAFSSRDRVGCEHRSRPLSGSRPQASLNAGSERRSSRSSASS